MRSILLTPLLLLLAPTTTLAHPNPSPNLVAARQAPSTACTSSSSSSSPSHLPTIWLAGDSTTAPDGGHNGTEGWGQFLKYSFQSPTTGLLTARVNNSAYAGRSMRSFTREGRFDAIARMVLPGDWVVIEMGINDVGLVLGADGVWNDGGKGRGACPGSGDETCVAVIGNTTEVVKTFVAYQVAAAKLLLAAGARVILSSRELTNPWEFGPFSYTPDRYANYSLLSTTLLGGPAAGVYWVPHGAYSAQTMRNLGKAVVDRGFPMDHTHTAPLLADYVARSFVLGLKCGSAPLAGLVVNATARIEGPELGTCLGAEDGWGI